MLEELVKFPGGFRGLVNLGAGFPQTLEAVPAKQGEQGARRPAILELELNVHIPFEAVAGHGELEVSPLHRHHVVGAVTIRTRGLVVVLGVVRRVVVLVHGFPLIVGHSS